MQSKNFPAASFSERPRPFIALEPVESNQVGAIGYDEATQTLAVQFRRGARAIYHYPNVSRETFEAFRGAESIGTYFGQHLKALPFEKFPNEDAASAA
jgi:hypothetical protein